MSHRGRIRSGLVSITFRTLSREQIVIATVDAGLEAIEWGGDVHCPHGDFVASREARRLCDEHGIFVSAYGSYYRVGQPESDKNPSFTAVLDSARELGARAIRVWAGGKGSTDASTEDRRQVVDDLVRICELAARQNVTIDLEYHGGTLTDTPQSTVQLLTDARRPNLRTYWQPRHGKSVDEGMRELSLLKPWLGNLHVFHWWPDPATRHPLREGVDRWAHYLKWIGGSDDRFASLEFVRNDDLAQLHADAQSLRELIAQSR